jgi:hypothetical protein
MPDRAAVDGRRGSLGLLNPKKKGGSRLGSSLLVPWFSPRQYLDQQIVIQTPEQFVRLLLMFVL